MGNIFSANDFWNTPVIFSPSLICLDHCNFENQVRVLEENGVEVLHVDIIDGHFSPSMPLGLETVRALRKKTNIRFDVHLMVHSQNDYFFDELFDIGVEQLIFHIETEVHPDMRLASIRKRGIRAGVALKPSTPLSTLDYIIERCDTVLLMLINPGYAGDPVEKQVPYAGRKIAELRRMLSEKNLSVKIELDGRVSKETIMQHSQGLEDKADIFVVGSSCLSKDNLATGVNEINSLRNSLLEEIRL